jgi:hypothetical protein
VSPRPGGTAEPVKEDPAKVSSVFALLTRFQVFRSFDQQQDAMRKFEEDKKKRLEDVCRLLDECPNLTLGRKNSGAKRSIRQRCSASSSSKSQLSPSFRRTRTVGRRRRTISARQILPRVPKRVLILAL